ncbi:MAG: hypothetical protein WBZ42_10085 [Halobacteriota archaeon]
MRKCKLNILNIKNGVDILCTKKNEGQMGMHHDMSKKSDWIMKKVIWEQLDDDAKKQYLLRKLDEKILKKEFKVKLAEHKIETLRLLKVWIER